MNLFKNVLFIGPNYKRHRGGIGAVLETYSLNISPFNFVSTYNYKSSSSIIANYILSLFKITWILVSNWKIKIVHIHSASKGSFFRKSVIVLISKLFFRKVVFHVHGGRFHLFFQSSAFTRVYIKFIVKLSDAIICLSPQWKQFFSAFIEEEKIYIANNPVDAPTNTIALPAEGEKLRMLFLGKVGDGKGVFDLLDALSKLGEIEKSKAQLVIGGDGETERLIETINSRKLSEVVFFEGWISGAEKQRLLSNSDVYILPSYNEGLPVSILEAMAYGLTVIATPVGGVPEIVKDGVNGFLVTPGNVECISKRIEQLIWDRSLLSNFRSASLNLVIPYRSEVVIENLEKIYVRLLN